MKTLAAPLIGIAALGLVLSVFVHLSALLQFRNPLGKAAWALHVGIFVVGFPAVLVAQRLTNEAKQKDWWRVALRGCPRWMQYMTYAFFVYAILNFGLFVLTGKAAKEDESIVLRGFSGHWMVFYSGIMAILYSFMRVGDVQLRCISGHPVSPLANYCEVCGQAIHQT